MRKMFFNNTTALIYANITLSQTTYPSDQTVLDLAKPQTPFLKEILMGRCYFNSPLQQQSQDPKCENIVGDIMSVLEGINDENITSEVFHNYLHAADFAPPKDKAIISYGKSYASGDEGDDFVTVENTPGGALMKDLSFCGVDKQQLGCTFGEFEVKYGVWHGAQAAFWFGALSKFIEHVEGHVRVVLEDSESLNQQGLILSTSMLKSMNANKVKSLEIIVSGNTSCDSKTVVDLRKSVILRGIKSDQVKCTETSSVKQSLYCATPSKAVTVSKADNVPTSSNSTSAFTDSSNCNNADNFNSNNGTSVIMLIIGFLVGIILSFVIGGKNHPSRHGYSEIPTHTGLKQ